MEVFVKAKEVAALLCKSEVWVLRQARAGSIPSFQIGRTRLFSESDIKLWLESKRRGPKYQAASEESETVNAGRQQAASAAASESRQPRTKRGRREIVFDKSQNKYVVKLHPPN